MVERQLKEYVSEKVFFVYDLLENYIGFEVKFRSDIFVCDKFIIQTHPLPHSVLSNLFLHNTVP